MIEAIVKEPEPGEIYYGKVVRLMNFGAFVNLLPGKDGMVHISKMADHRIEKVEDLSLIHILGENLCALRMAQKKESCPQSKPRW